MSTNDSEDVSSAPELPALPTKISNVTIQKITKKLQPLIQMKIASAVRQLNFPMETLVQ